MKNMKLIVSLLLIAAMLCACGGGSSVKAADLVGTWSMTFEDSADEAYYLLDFVDLYTEERAFVKDLKLDAVITVIFTEDTFSFQYDVDGNKACVRAYYEAVFAALYENRAELTDLYGEDVVDMDEATFLLFYADLYGIDSYEAFMNELVEGVYDYTALAETLKSGTYKIVGDSLITTPDGSEEKESMGFTLNGETLTLIYSDGDEVYTKVN